MIPGPAFGYNVHIFRKQTDYPTILDHSNDAFLPLSRVSEVIFRHLYFWWQHYFSKNESLCQREKFYDLLQVFSQFYGPYITETRKIFFSTTAVYA